MEQLSRYQPHFLAVLRIVTALLFIAHGTQKIFNFPVSAMAGEFPTLLMVGGWIEVVGGILILIGLFTRPAAFIASGMMAYAYWFMHYPANPFPTNNGGDAPILFCFVFLYLVFAGPGLWSVDAKIKK